MTCKQCSPKGLQVQYPGYVFDVSKDSKRVAKVTANGVDVTARCVRAYDSIVGRDGWAVVYDRPPQVCPCGNLVRHVLRGHIVVTTRELIPA